MQPTMRIARRCVALLLPRTSLLLRALSLGQTDMAPSHWSSG